MPRSPSFYTLYKQGRFRRRAVTEADLHEAIEQKERFAVAILAFVLQYDEEFGSGSKLTHYQEFQKTFVEKICNVTSTERIAIFVEIDGCGDLELRIGKQSYFFEFKLGDPNDVLKEKRKKENLNEEEIFLREGGYGYGIQQRCLTCGTAGNYIVLGSKRFDVKRNSPSLVCFSKTWSDIYDCDGKSDLAKDLFRSLGSLKIEPFTHMITKEYRVAKSATDAAKLHAVLEEVAKIFDFKGFKWEVEPDGSGIGINFSKKGLNGWCGYGYESTKPAICFYCKDTKGAKSIESRLRKKFPNSKSLRIDSGTVPEITQEDDSLTDQDWFDSVFESIFLRPQQT